MDHEAVWAATGLSLEAVAHAGLAVAHTLKVAVWAGDEEGVVALLHPAHLGVHGESNRIGQAVGPVLGVLLLKGLAGHAPTVVELGKLVKYGTISTYLKFRIGNAGTGPKNIVPL